MTQEEQIEYNKCCSDVVYFTNKYHHFNKYSVLLADFKLYAYQEEVLKSIDNKDSSVVYINTARQMGVTTILFMYSLWKMNFTNNYHIIQANVSSIRAIYFLDKLKESYDRLPDFLKTPAEVNNKRKLKLINGSYITIANSISSVVDISCDSGIIDNASFVSEDVFSSVAPRIKPGGKIIVNSTLYKQGWFQKACEKAEKDQSEFTYIRLPYYLHPKRDRLWRSNTELSIGVDGAIVENDCTHYYTSDARIKPLIED